MKESLERHCRMVVKAMAGGRAVPLLGAGANLCDRPEDTPWSPGGDLPSGSELSKHLARTFDYPLTDTTDLVRVSEYVEAACGLGPLYEALRRVFDAEYVPSALHELLADMTVALREHAGAQHQVIVTTNYDDALERAFEQAGEPFDLLVYMARGDHEGSVVHHLPDGDRRPIDRANDYRGVALAERSVILKIHGTVDRADEANDSFVISEDDYIDYLAHANPSALIPAPILARLERSHFVFLGYQLRDWNLRAMLHRIWIRRDLGYRSWAVHRNPDPVDEALWNGRQVDVYDVPLARYVVELRRQLDLFLDEIAGAGQTAAVPVPRGSP